MLDLGPAIDPPPVPPPPPPPPHKKKKKKKKKKTSLIDNCIFKIYSKMYSITNTEIRIPFSYILTWY